MLPVAVVQLVCVTVPITGALGTEGAALIAAEVDAVELHDPLLTVKV